MKYEETNDYVVFRECTVAQEMAQQYPDGTIVKTADELQKMDERSKEDIPLTMFFDGHTKDRLVGFAKPPKGLPSFANGKVKRDIYFDKEILTEQELESVRNIPMSDKKDLSIGFLDKTDYRKENWNGVSVDGFSTAMKLDHLSWEKNGRCNTEEGCGLTRSDSEQIRHDAFPVKEKEKESKDKPDDCVSKKTKLFISEGMDAGKASAAAKKYCSEKNKKSKDENKDKPKIKGDTVTDEQEKVRIDKSDEILAGISELTTSISSLVTQLQPKTDADRKDSDCECDEEERKDEKSESDKAPNEEILKRMDALEKENTDLKERFDNMPKAIVRKSYTLAQLEKIVKDKEENDK